MLFRVYSKDEKVYDGRISSVDGKIHAFDYQTATQMLNKYGEIRVIGKKEITITREETKGIQQIN